MRIAVEKISPDLESSLRCLEWDKPDFDSPHHLHPEIEITQILAGEGERLVGDRLGIFQPGEIALLGPNLPHYYKNWKSDRCHSRVIQFLPAIFGSDLLALPEFKGIAQLLTGATQGLLFSRAACEQADHVITQIFRSNSGADKLINLFKLLETLGQDQEANTLASVDFHSPYRPEHSARLQRVLSYIDDHWKESIRLEDVAKVACLHPQSFSRYFKKQLHKTYQDYLIDLRLSRAARMLMEADLTIAFIAFESGFNTLANFNRNFRDRYQCTPTQWRARFN